MCNISTIFSPLLFVKLDYIQLLPQVWPSPPRSQRCLSCHSTAGENTKGWEMLVSSHPQFYLYSMLCWLPSHSSLQHITYCHRI